MALKKTRKNGRTAEVGLNPFRNKKGQLSSALNKPIKDINRTGNGEIGTNKKGEHGGTTQKYFGGDYNNSQEARNNGANGMRKGLKDWGNAHANRAADIRSAFNVG